MRASEALYRTIFEQAAVGVDAADPDDAEVDPELADQLDGRLADDAAVVSPERTLESTVRRVSASSMTSSW